MKSRSNEIRRARPLLGTLVEIGAVGANAAAGVDAAFREIEIIHRLMSFHEENSDVSHINRAAPGKTVRVDPRTYEVLECAQWMSRLSAGAFDITIGGRLVEAGFLPRPHGAAAFDRKASFKDLLLLPDNFVTLTKRAWIDLSGIAKGYAVDRAVQVLKKTGVTSGIVNAGGDLSVFGQPQPIHIRHPETASLVLPLGPFSNAAIASSSGFFTAQRHNDALVEPRRGACVKWRQGVTVIAMRCMIADALTKIVRLVPRRAPQILEQFNALALVVDRRGVRCSVQLRSSSDPTCGNAFRSSIRPEPRCHSVAPR
ncbi:MAG: FAD:protein FMN transferase [Chloroflexota bacterium]